MYEFLRLYILFHFSYLLITPLWWIFWQKVFFMPQPGNLYDDISALDALFVSWSYRVKIKVLSNIIIFVHYQNFGISKMGENRWKWQKNASYGSFLVLKDLIFCPDHFFFWKNHYLSPLVFDIWYFDILIILCLIFSYGYAFQCKCAYFVLFITILVFILFHILYKFNTWSIEV